MKSLRRSTTTGSQVFGQLLQPLLGTDFLVRSFKMISRKACLLGLGATLLLLASAAPRAFGRGLLQDVDEFPPGCNCIRSRSSSPFRLELGQGSAVGGFFQYCFKVDRVPCEDPKSKCCDESQGVWKVEFEVGES
jgi:hypothetical protein